MRNKANVEWVKGLTRLPNVVGGSIANAVSGHIADGIKCGNFMAMSCTDIPDGSTSWGFNVQFFTGEHTVVIAKRSYSPAMWYAELDSAGWVPGGWLPIATATKPQEYALPLAEGITPNCPCRYFKTQDGVVTIILSVVHAAELSPNSTIATLPAGYRPTTDYYFAGLCYPSMQCALFGITAGGEIKIVSGILTGGTSITLSCTFVAS